MTVRRWMTTSLITIDKKDPVSLAFELLLANDIRHLPVLCKDKLVGIITDRDLQEAIVPCESLTNKKGIYNTFKDIPVEKIMTPSPVSIGPDLPIEQAAQMLIERKIDCLPVKNGKGKLIGLITSTDILSAFIEFLQVFKGTKRIDIVMETMDYEKVSGIIQQSGGKIVSIGITTDNDLSQKVYSFRIAASDIGALVSRLRQKGYAVLPVD